VEERKGRRREGGGGCGGASRPRERGEDDLYRLLQTVKGNKVVVFIREEEPGRYSVSLRSTTALDVGQVASSFGGGGHKQAAGFEMTGSLETIRKAMLGTFAALLGPNDGR